MSDELRPSDDLLSDLRAAGEADAPGHFTIDVAEAHRKMATFRLASAAHWLLPMVAHSVRAGARTLNFSHDLAQWRLSHDGDTLTREDLQRLLVLDGPATSPALAHLAAAIGGLVALGAEIDIESGPWRLQMDSGASRLVEAHDPAPGVGIRIVRPQAGLSGTQRVHRVGVRQELQLLHDACRHAPLDVRVNDRPLTREALDVVAVRWLVGTTGNHAEEPGPWVLAWESDFDARLALIQGRGGLTLVVDGLAFVETDDPRFERLGIDCVAWPSGLELDLSYGRIVHDAAWEAVVERLAREVPRVIVDVAEHPDRLSPAAMALAQACLANLSGAFAVDPALPIEHASLCLYAARDDLTSIDAAEIRKIVAHVDGRAESATLGRLETAAFEAWTRGGETFQRHLHEDLVERLRAAGPSRALIDALHRTVIRHARAMRAELALLFAVQAREAAFALTQVAPEERRGISDAPGEPSTDPMLRARALDVEALALRCMHRPADARRIHERARDLRIDAVMRARSDILLAELAMEFGAHRDALRRLRSAQAVFESSGEKIDCIDASVEIAHCLLQRDECAEAVRALDQAERVFVSEEHPQTRAARDALRELLRKRVRGPDKGGILGQLAAALRGLLNRGTTPPLHADLHRQQEILRDYFLNRLHKPERLVELLGHELLALEGSAPFGALWLITARRLAFAYRLASRYDAADALAARTRLVVPLWPLDSARQKPGTSTPP